jgi:hypothetical protein
MHHSDTCKQEPYLSRMPMVAALLTPGRQLSRDAATRNRGVRSASQCKSQYVQGALQPDGEQTTSWVLDSHLQQHCWMSAFEHVLLCGYQQGLPPTIVKAGCTGIDSAGYKR